MSLNEEMIKFILSYIKILKNDIEFITKYDLPDDTVFDDIRETVTVFKKEIPELDEAVLFRTGTAVKDANTCISLLKKHLISNGYKEEKLNVEYDNLNKMAVFLITYFNDIIENNPQKLNDKYTITEIDWSDDEEIIVGTNLDVNKEMKLKYGIDIGLENFTVSFENVKMIIELFYGFLKTKEDRYNYTIDINQAFSNFELAYKLNHGTIENIGYMTSFDCKNTINAEKFENKIKHAEKLILNNNILDKKTAVRLLADVLEYLVDIQEGSDKSKKKINLCKKICEDDNSRIYSTLKNEIEEIFKYTNDCFDIRHNKKNVETLNNSMFVEYLYNRIYAFIYLYRINDPKNIL